MCKSNIRAKPKSKSILTLISNSNNLEVNFLNSTTIKMSLATKVLKKVSVLTKQLPKHRKLNQLYKHINKLGLALGSDTIVVSNMQDGTKMCIDLSTRTERVSFYTGKYDSFFISTIKSLYQPDACFLDVGANIGFYTVAIGNYIREHNANGKVIAFEPFEGNFKRLTDNVKLNQLENFCVSNAFGLSDKSIQANITLREDFKHGSNTGNAAIPTSEDFDKGFELSPIQLEVLDEVWNKDFTNFGRIDIIKMDIEGHEDFCLQGGQKTIQKHRPTILMEVNKAYYEARNVALDDTFLKLIPNNYNIYKPVGLKWKLITSLNDCTRNDNVFLVPEEKLAQENYLVFDNEVI